MFCSLAGEEGQSIITILLLLLPAAFYILGLLEGKKGYYLFVLGLLFHLFSMVQRGLVLGNIPLTEKHDTISFMAFAMALAYWYFYRRKGLKNLGLTALPLISVIMFIAVKHIPINTVSPFLRTPWFFAHISFFFAAYALFGISSCIGILYLQSGNNGYEDLQYKGLMIGWVLFSISLVLGSIWFFISYGTYWLWTSKELWTTLTWFYYGLYLHARLMKGLRGRPASVIGISGFIVALFTYFGVGTILPSPPTQF